MLGLKVDLACKGLSTKEVSEANDMLDLFAEGGSRPAMPTYFLCRCAGPPESRQRARPYFPRPSGFACGQPAPSSSWGCAAKLTARLWRFVQTVAASQITKRLHSAVQPPAPRACRRRRGHKGQYRDSFFVFLIAATAICISARGQFRHKSCRPSDPAPSRVDAPVARDSGCGQRCRRTALLRELTRRRLFERSGMPRSEFGGTAD